MEIQEKRQILNQFLERAKLALYDKYKTKNIFLVKSSFDEATIEINNKIKMVLYYKYDNNFKQFKPKPFSYSVNDRVKINNNKYGAKTVDLIDIEIKSLKNKYKTSNVRYLSKGAEGRVYVINDKEVVKIYKVEKTKQFEYLEKQVHDFQIIDGTVKPKNIEKIVIDEEEHIIQTSKYMKNGDLRSIIINNNDNRIFFPIAFWLVLDLFYTHQAGFVHLDLRADNVIINDKGKPKIIDYTLSEKINGEILERGFNFCVSPDLLQNKIIDKNKIHKIVKNPIKIKVSDKHDIYSLGFLFCRMFFNRSFFEDIEDFELITPNKKVFDILREYNEQFLLRIEELKQNKKLREKQMTLLGEDEVKLRLLNLINSMINPNTQLRPSSKEILEEMTRIYNIVSKNYSKYTINGKEYDFSIKNKEKLFSGISNIEEINFKKEEIDKMSKSTGKIVNFILKSKVSDNLKHNLKNYLNSKHGKYNEKKEIMSDNEKRFLIGITERLALMRKIKKNEKLINMEEFNLDISELGI